jgi:hypothetical protein
MLILKVKAFHSNVVTAVTEMSKQISTYYPGWHDPPPPTVPVIISIKTVNKLRILHVK